MTHALQTPTPRRKGRSIPSRGTSRDTTASQMTSTTGNVSAGQKSPRSIPDILLENTDEVLRHPPGVGAPHHCSLGAAAYYLLFMLTRAVLMPALFQRPNRSGVDEQTRGRSALCKRAWMRSWTVAVAVARPAHPARPAEHLDVGLVFSARIRRRVVVEIYFGTPGEQRSGYSCKVPERQS